MYVEDLLLTICKHLNSVGLLFDGLLDDPWHRNFISNVSAHVEAGKQLSTNQSRTILKLVGRVRQQIVRNGLATAEDIDLMLRQPEHRRPLYQSANVPREVRHLGDNLLAFRFKQNDLVVQRIKEFGLPVMTDWAELHRSLLIPRMRFELLPRPRFDWDYKIWVVPVLRPTIMGIIALINEYRFGLDDATQNYLQLARQSLDQQSAVVLHADREVLLANVCDNPLLAGWMTEVAGGISI